MFIYKEKLLELCNTAVVSSCSTSQRCNWHSHFHAARSSRVWWAALKRSTSSDFLAFELKAIPLSFNNSFKTATVIFSAGPCFIRSYFLCFSLFAASSSFFSWRSGRSRCPSISATVSLCRRRMTSADGVSGIFWMNWRESRKIYFFKRKSFFASFV